MRAYDSEKIKTQVYVMEVCGAPKGFVVHEKDPSISHRVLSFATVKNRSMQVFSWVSAPDEVAVDLDLLS